METFDINSRLFDVLDYVEKEIFEMKSKKIDVTENYIADNISIINYELLLSIKELYSRTKINNAEYQLHTNKSERLVITKKAQALIPYFNVFLEDVKEILLNTVPLEVTGYVTKLYSRAPLHSQRNEVTMTAEVANVKEKIKVILKSDDYIQAVEAHSNERPIKIKGKAKQTKKTLIISDVEEFSVMYQ